MLALDLSPLPPGVRLGTSSFSTADWTGLVYPPGTRPGDYLVHYARLFPSVEIDATFYAVPSRPTVAGWAAKTPQEFTFSLKVPQAITHERGLVDCGEEWRRFLAALEPLGRKRGPLLFQFPYVAKRADPREYETGDGFRARLAAFLPQLPAGARAVVEVRNAKWLAPPLLDLLRERGVPLALTAYYSMPGVAELLSGPDPLTGPVAYVRFLGDHRRMDVQPVGDEAGRDARIIQRRCDQTWFAMIERRHGVEKVGGITRPRLKPGGGLVVGRQRMPGADEDTLVAQRPDRIERSRQLRSQCRQPHATIGRPIGHSLRRRRAQIGRGVGAFLARI